MMNDRSVDNQHGLDLARQAITHYDLNVTEVVWLAHTHNAVFSVQAGDGARYVLRLLNPSADPAYFQSEQHWLDRLYAARLAVPRVIPAKAGPVTVQRDDGQTIHAALFTYLTGESHTPESVQAADMQRIGDFLARMHTVDPPDDNDFQRPRLDFEGLYGKNSPYASAGESDVFSPRQREVMGAAAQQVKAAMDTLGQDSTHFRMIHGDLLLKNILFEGDMVKALDFEYCGWGYTLYDLTPLLWGLKSQPRYPELAAALWDGYATRRPVIQTYHSLLEAFIAGRQVASMRWLAANLDNPSVRSAAPDLIAQRTGELEGFLETGVLHRESQTL